MTQEERELLRGFLVNTLETADHVLDHYNFVLDDLEAVGADEINGVKKEQVADYLTAMREDWAAGRAKVTQKLERLDAGEDVDLYDDDESQDDENEPEEAAPEVDPAKAALVDEIRKEIEKNGSFMVFDGLDYGLTYITKGISLLVERSEGFADVLQKLADRFEGGDLGEWLYPEDKAISESLKAHGKETGCYQTEYGTIEIKRDVLSTTAYLPFER